MKTETYVFLARFREPRELPDSREADDPGAAESTLAVIEDLTAAEARMVTERVERDAREAPLFLGQPVQVWAETESESAAHALHHGRRCRQAKEVEESLRDLPNEESQNDAVYFLASAVLSQANSLRWLRRRLTAPIRERLAYDLHRDRMRRLHADLLRASGKYPNLCHFAVDVATAHSYLDDARRRRLGLDDPDVPYAWSLDLGDIGQVGLAEMSFLVQAGGGPSLGPLVTAFDHLEFDSANWYGCFHVKEDAEVQAAASGIALFRELTESIVEEERGPQPPAVLRHPWLEMMYGLFFAHRARFDSGVGRGVAWLPHNVFLASARAIEEVTRREGFIDVRSLQALKSAIEQLIAIIDNNPPEAAFDGTAELTQRVEALCGRRQLPCAIRFEISDQAQKLQLQYPYRAPVRIFRVDEGAIDLLGPDRFLSHMTQAKRTALFILRAWARVMPLWADPDEQMVLSSQAAMRNLAVGESGETGKDPGLGSHLWCGDDSTELQNGSEKPMALRFRQLGEEWIVATNWVDKEKAEVLPDGLHKLHVVANNAIHFIDSVAWPFADAVHNDAGKECSYAQACIIDLTGLIKDLNYLFLLADEGWRLLEMHDRALARSAGGPVSACGVHGVSGHEVVLKIADRVLCELPWKCVFALPARRIRPSLPYLQEYVDTLRPDRVLEEFERIPRRLRFMNEDELRTLEAQILREYMLANEESPGTRTIPPEERTVPMSYRRAARLMGKADSKDAAEWLSASVKDGSIPCEDISRQMHVFSIRNFPKAVWPQILPPGAKPTDPNSP